MPEMMSMMEFRLDKNLSDSEFVEEFFSWFPRGGVSYVRIPSDMPEPFLRINLYVPKGLEECLDKFLKFYAEEYGGEIGKCDSLIH